MNDEKILDIANEHLNSGGSYRFHKEDLIAFAQSLLDADRNESSVDKQLNAYKTLVDSLEKQVSFHERRRKQHEEAVATLESERECNARLTEENYKLAAGQFVPVYHRPQPKARLTDEEIEDMAREFEEGYVFSYLKFARAIEQRIWEKNS